MVVNKSISLIGESKETTIIDGGGTGKAVFVTANNVTIAGFTIQRGDSGIHLWSSCNCVITENNVFNNWDGIFLCRSKWNNIFRNIVANNGAEGAGTAGIELEGNCWYNAIAENMLINNEGYGIQLRYNSSQNSIIKNNVTESGTGIDLYEECDGNNICGNIVTNNAMHGISLSYYSVQNNISRNTVKSNKWGIDLSDIGNDTNLIYHNNFIDNIMQVRSYESISVWDDGYPSGGNYWSDYTGVDSDHDGIGDSSHILDADNQDNYPLMGMFSSFPISYLEEVYDVDVICNSTISGFEFDHENRIIDFDVTGSDGTIGFCRIIVPRALIESPYTILVDGQEIPYTELPISNITHAFLYFTYSHSTHHIKIFTSPPLPPPVGGKAVPIIIPIIKPELQIPWIWITTIILPLVATAVYVNKRKREVEMKSRSISGIMLTLLLMSMLMLTFDITHVKTETPIENNQSPVASFTCLPTVPYHTLFVKLPVHFDASASYDPDGFITMYYWNFSDGLAYGVNKPGAVRTYTNAGDYTVNLTVKDNEGATDTTDTYTFTVREPCNPQEGEVTINPIDDTYTDANNPDENYGNQTTLYVSNITEGIAWLKFDLDAVPDGAVVDDALLKLHALQPTETYDVCAHWCSDNSWTESTLTYSNMPSFNASQFIQSMYRFSYGGWGDWNVADAVRRSVDGIHDGPDIMTIVISGIPTHHLYESSNISFHSKEALYVPELTVHWIGTDTPEYTLTINSSPTGVTFTVDSVPNATPWSETYCENTSVSLVMPEAHDGYEWSHWQQDGDPNRIKTATMDTNITLTAVYEPAPPPPVGGKATPINLPISELEMLAPYIGLTILLAVAVTTIVYVKKRKRHTDINS